MHQRKYLPILKILAFCVAFLSFTNSVFGQSAIDSTKKRLTSIQQAETGVTLSFDPKRRITLLYSVPKYKYSFKSSLTTTVDSIIFSVKDGFIVNIVVFANGQEFTNVLTPIAITENRMARRDLLKNKKKPDEYITFQDVMDAEFNNSDVPDDQTDTLNAKKPSIPLARNLGVDNVFSLELFSDALGLFGGTPNAIAQTEAQYRHIIHRANLFNTGLLAPWEYLKINFSAAKFDSKNRFVDSAKLSRSRLLQKSYLNIEAASNLIYFWLERKSASYGYVDFGTGINEGIIAKKKDTVSVLTPNIFFEGGFNLRPSSNLGVDLSIRYINQYSPETNFKNNLGNNESKQEQFWKLGFDLFWNPKDKSSGRIFARSYYVISRNHQDQSNGFLQFQFGYALTLSSVAGAKAQK